MTTEALVLQTSPVVTVGYVFQVLLSLAVVVGLIVVIARYLLPRLNITSGGGKVIQVVDRVMLEPQVSAYLLKVKERTWLTVASSKNVAPLEEVQL
jgi:flagellar biogenesis protein FliO